MPTKICVFITGLVYLFFGIAGLIPGFVFLPPPRLRYYDMTMIGHWGFLFTWLPVNTLHDILYIVIGALAIITSLSRTTAILYARGLFFLMIMLSITGFLPFGIDRLWGLLPLFTWNIMLHSVTAMLLFYYGFIYPIDQGGKEPPREVQILRT
jgi:hypothetical protein